MIVDSAWPYETFKALYLGTVCIQNLFFQGLVDSDVEIEESVPFRLEIDTRDLIASSSSETENTIAKEQNTFEISSK